MLLQRLSIYILVLLLTALLPAQEFTFEVKTNKEDAIYSKGEDIVFSLRLLKDTQAVAGRTISYNLVGDGNLRENGTFISSKTPYTVQSKLDFPGWVYIRCVLLDDDGKPVKFINQRNREEEISGSIGAMVDPYEIKAAGEEPADFDAFWQRARAELSTVPLEAKLEPMSRGANDDGKLSCYDIKIPCPGGMPVSGYLVKPSGAKPKSLPALISYHGAGVRSAVLSTALSYARRGFIAMDVNAHGIENGQPPEFYTALSNNELKDYRSRDKDDPEKFYFRGMYQRVMRSLEYIKTCPEWDGKTLVVIGGSQGGAQSLVAAALDPQVTLCLAGVPAMSEHSGPLAQPPRQAGWPRLYRANAQGKPDNEKVCRTAAYFDNIYFAKRIKADCFLSTGFVDTTCPPTGVFAVFNNLPQGIRKEITLTPAAGHGAPNTKGDAYLKKLGESLQKKAAAPRRRR